MKDLFDGYTIELLLDEDQEYLAYFRELSNVSACGPTPEAALKELRNAWELMKEDYLASNEPVPIAPSRREYTGTFNVRVGKDLHRALVMEASVEGLSLNAFISQKLVAVLHQHG